MPIKSRPVIARSAPIAACIIVSCVAAVGAIIASIIDSRITNKTNAMALASQQCQQDLKVQIAQLQVYLTEKKMAQASGKSQDPKVTALLTDKFKAIQAFKSRC